MAMMALSLLTGLGTALIVGTMTETHVAVAQRHGFEVFYAAEAAVEFVIRDLVARDDWSMLLDGTERSAFADGPRGGVRRVGGRDVDLTRATREMDALLALRPVTARAARLYAYGPFANLLSAREDETTAAYVCVWVAELMPEVAEDPPARLVSIIGRAYGVAGGQRTVLVTLARLLGPDERWRVRRWEELR
jgi:hypothetical protein